MSTQRQPNQPKGLPVVYAGAGKLHARLNGSRGWGQPRASEAKSGVLKVEIPHLGTMGIGKVHRTSDVLLTCPNANIRRDFPYGLSHFSLILFSAKAQLWGISETQKTTWTCM